KLTPKGPRITSRPFFFPATSWGIPPLPYRREWQLSAARTCGRSSLRLTYLCSPLMLGFRATLPHGPPPSQRPRRKPVEPTEQKQTASAETRHTASFVGKDELLRGFFRILLLYDVADALDLAKIREMVGPRGGSVELGFSRRTPEYIRFEQAPIIETV